MWPFKKKNKSLFKPHDPYGMKPKRSTKYSAGHDLHANVKGSVKAGQRLVVPTGVGWGDAVDDKWFGQIVERSGNAVRHGILTLGGIIDCDYDGEIMVILHNLGDQTFNFEKGDRIAQLVVMPYMYVEGSEKVRAGGFGSTGK